MMIFGVARFYSIVLALFTGSGLAIALYAQHYLDHMPCAWCILQRIIFMIIFVVSVINIFLKSRFAIRIMAAINALMAVGGIAAVIYQFWAASQEADFCFSSLTWVEEMTNATGLSSAYPEVFGVYASCADAVIPIFGVPYPMWSGALFAMVFILSLAVVVRLKKID